MIKAVRFRVRSRIRDRVRIKVLVQNATMTTTAANPNLDMTAVDPNSRVRNLDGPGLQARQRTREVGMVKESSMTSKHNVTQPMFPWGKQLGTVTMKDSFHAADVAEFWSCSSIWVSLSGLPWHEKMSCYAT